MPMPFIHPERRLAGGGPLAAFEDELPALHAAGVRAVVCLLNIPSDALVYESAGIAFHCAPVPDGGAPTMEQTNQFITFVNQQRAAGHPVAVHCEAGLGRTGTMIATYLISQGDSAESAIRRVRASESVGVETPRQIQFLEQYANRVTPRRISDSPPRARPTSCRRASPATRRTRASRSTSCRATSA